jgi:hypothetical protein
MKILTCILRKYAVILLLSLISFSFCDGPNGALPLKKNQLKTFPNTYEAPTMKSQIPESNYQAPRLSSSLLENDPSRRLRKTEFLDTIKYTFYKMTRGELEQIFGFVDVNKDDMVDQKEWDGFSSLFVFPFEACDENGDYILDEVEFKKCFEADPKSKSIDWRRRFQQDHIKLMMSIVSTRGANELNFNDYLFIRKALFGWTQCHSNSKYIAKSHFKCALGASIPQKYYSKLDYETIYRVGLKMADRNLIEMDFISYLRILYYTYVFGVFNMPSDTQLLEKQQFIKSIKEDRLPNNFEESEIETIYELINNSATMKVNRVSSIDFESWSFFFGLHRMFNKYSIERPLQMNMKEFINMLNDPFINNEILMAIDASYTKFDEQHYQEASLVLQKYRLNEKDFFFARFKQDASASTYSVHKNSTINANYYNMNKNDTNREVFFTIFQDANTNHWLKTNLYRAFQLANLYVSLTDYTYESTTRVVSSPTFVEKLPSQYDIVRPAINMKQRSNYVIYKALPRSIGVDILTFLALENFFTKFRITSMSSNINVEETKVKIVLKDFGMQNMPDTVLDLSGKGYDQLHRRTYSPLEIAKNTCIVHAVASENMRNHESIIAHKLKPNIDASRKYPTRDRRFMSSDKI